MMGMINNTCKKSNQALIFIAGKNPPAWTL